MSVPCTSCTIDKAIATGKVPPPAAPGPSPAPWWSASKTAASQAVPMQAAPPPVPRCSHAAQAPWRSAAAPAEARALPTQAATPPAPSCSLAGPAASCPSSASSEATEGRRHRLRCTPTPGRTRSGTSAMADCHSLSGNTGAAFATRPTASAEVLARFSSGARIPARATDVSPCNSGDTDPAVPTRPISLRVRRQRHRGHLVHQLGHWHGSVSPGRTARALLLTPLSACRRQQPPVTIIATPSSKT